MLHKQVAIFKQVRNFLLKPLALLRQFAFGAAGTPPPKFGLLGSEFFAHLGDRSQDGMVQFFQNMELTDLMGHVPENLRDCRRIERRAIGGDAPHRQLALLQDRLKAQEKRHHVDLGGRMVKHLVKQPLEASIVHDG